MGQEASETPLEAVDARDTLTTMGEPKGVLVVEDEILIRLTLADELVNAGFHVIEASTADEALKVLQSSVMVDLLLTDIRMPGNIDGLELARRARADRPALKIILMSSHLPTAAANLPADVFLAKPYPWADLVVCVQSLLGEIKNDGS